MKKLVILIAVMLVAQVSFTQIFSWGIKGGVNSSKVSFDDFSVNPTIELDYDYLQENNLSVTDVVNENGIQDYNAFKVTADAEFSPSSYEMGYHFGAFARLKLLGIFIQPELIFSHTEAAIDFSQPAEDVAGGLKESSATINYNNFDIPVMVGMKLGPARFNLGPVASFKLSPNVEGAQGEVKESLQDFSSATEFATFGGQVGLGVDILKKLTLDIRYEFPLSKLGDQVTIGDNTYNTDQRQTQVIASIGWMF